MRWVFATQLDPTGLAAVETVVTPEGATVLGKVRSAPHLRVSATGLWSRMLGATPRVELQPPFDARGNDVLGLFAWGEPFTPEAPLGSVRSVRGVVTCVGARATGDSVVLRDVWMRRDPVLRITSGVAFAVDGGTGPLVVVQASQAPFLLAPGSPAPLDCVLRDVDPRIEARLREGSDVPWSHPAETAILEEKDTVDVVGVVVDGERLLVEKGAAYREAPTTSAHALGDAPGRRLVIRRLR